MSDELLYKALGRAIATRREKLGLTQATLAARIGMSRASIANIESGRQNVLLHHIYHLASALDFSQIAELLPALPKPATTEGLKMHSSNDTVTDRDKAQISDLIVRALGTRTAGKTGS